MLAQMKKLNLFLALLMLVSMPALAFAQDGAEVAADDDLGDGLGDLLSGDDDLTAGLDTEVVDVSDELLDIEGMDLEALLNVEVSSVAGVDVSLHETPAALFVITSDDLRRTGVQSIPEALRLVPGMQVYRQDATNWGISARGYNSLFSNKMLVIQDGRSIYTPIFAGVYWDSHEVMLEDIATLEVIRGPGATLWGANAVNGVINITSKKAEETQGLYITGLYGNEENGGAVRYGGKIGEDTHYRVWARYRDIEPFDTISPATVNDIDGAQHWFAGARIDHKIDENTNASLHLKGARGTNLTSSSLGGGLPTRVNDSHFNNAAYVLEVKHENPEKEMGWSLKTYFDYYRRASEDTPATLAVPFPPFAVPITFTGLSIQTSVLDVEGRHHFKIGDRHQFIYGAGFRQHWDKMDEPLLVTPAFPVPGFPVVATAFGPQRREYAIFSGFVQDTITIVEDKLNLMIGSKFSHNDYSGYEIQPSARLWYTPTEETTIWASASRAVRSPSRVENDIFFGGAFLGNRNVEAENLIALEAGFRQKIGKRFSADVATYLNMYNDLISYPVANTADAKSYGAEVSLNYKPVDNVRLAAGYTVSQVNETGPSSGIGPNVETMVPQHVFNARAHWDVLENLEANAVFYFSTGFTGTAPDVHTMTRLDLGLTYFIAENIELAIWGQNLLDDSSFEFRDGTFGGTAKEVERSFYVQLTFTDE